MDYHSAIDALKLVPRWNRELIRINQDIEVLEHQMTGLARSAPELSPEQARSRWPLPTYQHNPDASPIGMIEACEAKRKEAQLRILLIGTCAWVDRLDEEDRQAVMEIYLCKRRYDLTAAKFGYTKKGFYKHIKSQIESLK